MIEMMLVYNIIVCMIPFWNKVNPFITKRNKNRQFLYICVAVTEIHSPYQNLRSYKADDVISFFNNELSFPSAFGATRGGDKCAPETPPSKRCAQPGELLGI